MARPHGTPSWHTLMAHPHRDGTVVDLHLVHPSGAQHDRDRRLQPRRRAATFQLGTA